MGDNRQKTPDIRHIGGKKNFAIYNSERSEESLLPHIRHRHPPSTMEELQTMQEGHQSFKVCCLIL